MICPLYRGCPLLIGSNCIILIGRDKFGDLVLSVFNTVSLSRRVLFERFHCIQIPDVHLFSVFFTWNEVIQIQCTVSKIKTLKSAVLSRKVSMSAIKDVIALYKR